MRKLPAPLKVKQQPTSFEIIAIEYDPRDRVGFIRIRLDSGETRAVQITPDNCTDVADAFADLEEWVATADALRD